MMLRHLLASVAIAAVVAFAGTAGAVEKLKFAHVYETSEPYHKWNVWAADELKKRSNGRFEMQVFPASSLGKESDINEGLSLGTVDMIVTGNQFLGRSYGPISIAGYPYVFASVGHWQKFVKSDLFRYLGDGFEKATGHHVITANYYGQRHVTSKKPIRGPADLKGVKIRVPDAPAYTIFPRAVGANPTPIAFAEVYLALQQGVVDAQENPLPTILAKKFYEVQSHINLTGHITDSLITVVASHVWKKLNDADKKMFTQIWMEVGEKITADTMKSEKDLVAWYEQQGKTVIKDVDIAAMQKATAAYYDANPKEVPWPKDVWDRMQAINK